MYKHIFLLLFTFSHFNGLTQCPPDNVYLSSQTEMDQFIMKYPNCTTISGNLWIFSDVVDLYGLKNITTIDGYLKINSCDELTNLKGLDSLNYVGGDMSISFCDNLKNVNGIGKLSKVGESLRFYKNPSLSNITALNNLDSIGEHLSIDDNKTLNSIIGLNNITTIGGHLIIEDSPNLKNLSGLENLQSIESYLSISNNQNLTSLSGLENLKTIGGSLGIGENEKLSNLLGLQNLTSVGGIGIAFNPSLTNVEHLSNLNYVNGSLYFGYNDVLSSLAGLENVIPSTITQIHIYYNPLLSYCNVNSICNAFPLVPSNLISIANNALGCDTQEEIKDACNIVSTSEVFTPKTRFSIYPNPSSNFLKTTAKIGTSYLIVDQSGKQKLKGTITTNHQIDLSPLSSGIYFIKFEHGSVKRFVKI